MSEEVTKHKWPADGEHIFEAWKPESRSHIYRRCVHPLCNHIERKKI